MSNRAITWAYAQKTGTPGRKLVLLKLADQANDDGYCWPSKQTIADDCEMNAKSVQRILRDLENELGLITIEARGRQHTGFSLSNGYYLNMSEGGTEDAPHPDKGEPRVPQGEPEVPQGEPTMPTGGTEGAPLKNPQSTLNEPSKEPTAAEFFTEFWSAYPKRQGKVQALKAMKSLNPDSDLRDTIMQDLAARKERRAELDRRGIWYPAWPNASTWINNRRWEDDLDALPESGEGGWSEWVRRGQSVGLDWSDLSRKYNAEFGGGAKKFIKDVTEAEAMEEVLAGAE